MGEKIYTKDQRNISTFALEIALVEWVRGHSTKSVEFLGADCDCEFPELTTTMSSEPGFCKP